MDEDIVIPIAFFLTVIILVIFVPLARAWAKSIGQRDRASALPPGMNEQLSMLQQSVDAMALEVERISEAQRFTTRLLSEQAGAPRAAVRAAHQGGDEHAG